MKTNIDAAISRSESHNEITHIRVTKDDAKPLIAQAERIATEAGLGFDSSDANNGWDMWAYKQDAPDGEMVWRVKLDLESL
jgi:hypothetical protein